MSAPTGYPQPDSCQAESRLAALAEAVGLSEGEALDRVYLFEPVERAGVSFTLALVTKRLSDDRLEMIALGARSDADRAPIPDFVRRARFPRSTLPEILAEFIDRCGVEGALHREVPLDGRDPGGRAPLERLAELLAPAEGGT